MEWALRWLGADRIEQRRQEEPTTASFSRERPQPVLVAVIHGPILAEMAREALEQAGIFAVLRRNPVAEGYGVSAGRLGDVPLFVAADDADDARDILCSMGMVDEA